MTVQSPPGAPQPPAPQKKGLSALAWVGIGCGVIIVLMVIFLVGGGVYLKHRFGNPRGLAELVVRANPDLEVEKVDDQNQSLTIRNKKTGEVGTISFADIKNGKLNFKSDKGSATFGLNTGDKDQGLTIKTTDDKGKESTLNFNAGAAKDVPSWVPMYPGASTQQGGFSASSGEGKGGTLILSSSDSTDKVAAYYESEMKKAGFDVQKMTFSAGNNEGATNLTGTSADKKRTLTVGVTKSSGSNGTGVSVSWAEKP